MLLYGGHKKGRLHSGYGKKLTWLVDGPKWFLWSVHVDEDDWGAIFGCYTFNDVGWIRMRWTIETWTIRLDFLVS